jgi:hypothetical protein
LSHILEQGSSPPLLASKAPTERDPAQPEAPPRRHQQAPIAPSPTTKVMSDQYHYQRRADEHHLLTAFPVAAHTQHHHRPTNIRPAMAQIRWSRWLPTAATAGRRSQPVAAWATTAGPIPTSQPRHHHAGRNHPCAPYRRPSSLTEPSTPATTAATLPTAAHRPSHAQMCTPIA